MNLANRTSEVADVAVAGAGVVGLALTLGLLRQGWRVALVAPPEAVNRSAASHSAAASTGATASDAWRLPVYALSPAVMQMLSKLGVDINDTRPAYPVARMEIRARVSGSKRIAQLTLPDRATSATAPLAYIVEEAALLHALHRALNEADATSNRLSRYSQHFSGLERHPNHIALTLQDQRLLRARVVAGCDGGSSAVRKAAGIAIQQHRYGDEAVVANFVTELPTHNVAAQWFHANEVVALLPTGDHAMSLVWSCSADRARELCAMSIESLQTQLAQITDKRFGVLTTTMPLGHWPLSWSQSMPMAHDRVILAGDAAHRIHPLAGQGLNLGLQDVAAWLTVVAEREPQRAIDDPRLVQRYLRRRELPVRSMRELTDGLHGLFSTAPAWVQAGARAGLNALDRAPLLKNALVRYAGG